MAKLRETWDDRYDLINKPNLHYGVIAVGPTTPFIGPYNAGVDSGESVILVDTDGSVYTVNLPFANQKPGMSFFIKKTDISGAAVKIQPQAGNLIDGLASNSTIAAQYDCLHIVSDGGLNWWIIGEAGPSF
jgi:hypothetical protein